ncbi:MAG TPA: hypothetical protein VFQ77_16105 [Pseudonocardiaceae bacterium]|nr:hypothetical protein [Pseudonocardiaceae bacterium]
MEKVVVAVADDHLDELPAVLADLRQAGLVVDSVQEVLGTVTGSVDASAFGKLQAVPGVAVVQRERGFQLPPPDADVQ